MNSARVPSHLPVSRAPIPASPASFPSPCCCTKRQREERPRRRARVGRSLPVAARSSASRRRYHLAQDRSTRARSAPGGPVYGPRSARPREPWSGGRWSATGGCWSKPAHSRQRKLSSLKEHVARMRRRRPNDVESFRQTSIGRTPSARGEDAISTTAPPRAPSLFHVERHEQHHDHAEPDHDHDGLAVRPGCWHRRGRRFLFVHERPPGNDRRRPGHSPGMSGRGAQPSTLSGRGRGRSARASAGLEEDRRMTGERRGHAERAAPP